MLRNLKFISQLALLGLALSLSAGLSKAQNAYEGTFTLPFEARWGSAVLPPGDYTIVMQRAVEPYFLYVRGESKTAIIMSQGTSTKGVSDESHLTIMNTGGEKVITELAAGQIGVSLNYPTPKMKRPVLVHLPVASPPASGTGD